MSKFENMKAHPFERYIDEKEGDARFRATGSRYRFDIYDNIMRDTLIFKAFIKNGEAWERCVLVSCEMKVDKTKATVSACTHFSNIAKLKYSGKTNGRSVSIPYSTAWKMMIRYIANSFGFIPALDGINWDKGKGEKNATI